MTYRAPDRRAERPGLRKAAFAPSLAGALLLALLPAILVSRTAAQAPPVFHASPTAFCGDLIPIRLSLVSSSAQGGTIQCTVDVDQVPAGGGSVQVNTDRPDLLVSPTGSWPYVLTFPAGAGTSMTFPISRQLTSSTATANVGACQTGVDSSNPANWQASSSVMLQMGTVD